MVNSDNFFLIVCITMHDRNSLNAKMILPKQFLVVFMIAVTGIAVDAQDKKQYQAMRVDEAPRIDGQLDDACWSREVETPPQHQQKNFHRCSKRYTRTVEHEAQWAVYRSEGRSSDANFNLSSILFGKCLKECILG